MVATYRSEFYVALTDEEFVQQYGAPSSYVTAAEAELERARDRRDLLGSVLGVENNGTPQATHYLGEERNVPVVHTDIPYSD
jgi:hypothetical protein